LPTFSASCIKMSSFSSSYARRYPYSSGYVRGTAGHSSTATGGSYSSALPPTTSTTSYYDRTSSRSETQSSTISSLLSNSRASLPSTSRSSGLYDRTRERSDPPSRFGTSSLNRSANYGAEKRPTYSYGGRSSIDRSVQERETRSPSKEDLATINVHPKGTCDKCDGPHLTNSCPIFTKDWDDHPDAKRGPKPKSIGDIGSDNFIMRSGRVVPQPGDGSCLFHSLAYGLGRGANARQLRREICSYIESRGDLNIADTPLKDWVKYDSGGSVASYACRMSVAGGGGGLRWCASHT